MAVDMFLKLEGIKGESADGKHKEEIDVLAWSWGAAQHGSRGTGAGGGSGKVQVQDISFTKYVDSATAALLQDCCAGSHIPSATLTVRKAGGKAPLDYLTITLKEVLVSSISTGGSGGEDRITENVTLNFASFKLEYKPQKADGSADGPKTATWNIAKNTP
ncbi:MAG TPA: type VI secretion system tube protein Hcp [Polyangiaceae bacterium]|nr:type VI secretion system tube protein Hcp [Polyangiaceae bacterium]